MNAMDMPAGLGDKAANTVLGQPATVPDFDSDMYYMRKLTDQIIAALDGSNPRPIIRAATAEEIHDRAVEWPVEPELVWDDQPCPAWPDFDYTAPAQ